MGGGGGRESIFVEASSVEYMNGKAVEQPTVLLR